MTGEIAAQLWAEPWAIEASVKTGTIEHRMHAALAQRRPDTRGRAASGPRAAERDAPRLRGERPDARAAARLPQRASALSSYASRRAPADGSAANDSGAVKPRSA